MCNIILCGFCCLLKVVTLTTAIKGSDSQIPMMHNANVLCYQKGFIVVSSDVQMPREYVANGSPYQADVCYTDSEAGQWASIVIDVGDVYQLPTTARYLSIKLILSDERQREILRNLRVNEGQDSDRLTIITERAYTVHGHKNSKDSRDWMWKSDSDGTNHRPRKFFVANASGGEILVQPEADDDNDNDRFVHIYDK